MGTTVHTLKKKKEERYGFPKPLSNTQVLWPLKLQQKHNVITHFCNSNDTWGNHTLLYKSHKTMPKAWFKIGRKSSLLYFRRLYCIPTRASSSSVIRFRTLKSQGYQFWDWFDLWHYFIKSPYDKDLLIFHQRIKSIFGGKSII